jgi:adenylate cyclase
LNPGDSTRQNHCAAVLAALRQDPELAEIPVIMITIVDEQRRSIALGAAGYLTKPIDRERLRRVIGRFRAPARPTRVLMVEDDAVQRERMRGWLEGPRWIVREAENGREALNRIQENKPEVILLDLMMPEMDGFAVVAALQKEAGWRDIPVIVITARDLNAKDRERLNSGVQIRAGQGNIPTGRPGRARPPARADEACGQQRDGSSIVTKVLYVEGIARIN